MEIKDIGRKIKLPPRTSAGFSGFLYRHRYSLFFFAYVSLYNFLIVNRCSTWTVSRISYAYHVVDYGSLGFRAQILPGSVFYGLFGEKSSEEIAAVFDTVLMLAFFAGLAILLERFMLRVGEKDRKAAVVLILFFLSGMFTFAIYTDMLGMLDVYWLYFALLFFFFLNNRVLRLLIPLLFAASMLVHFSSVMNYMILFSLVLLYRASVGEPRRDRTVYFCIFAISLAVSAGLFAYFLIHSNDPVPMTIDEFHALLRKRGSDYPDYYDYAFFNTFIGIRDVVPQSVFEIADPARRIAATVLEKIRFTFYLFGLDPMHHVFMAAQAALVAAPAVCFYYKHLVRFFISLRGAKLKRFCVFLMMVQVPFTLCACVFSVDIVRWSSHAFTVAFVLFLYVMYNEKELRGNVLADLERYRTRAPFIIYFFAYALVNDRGYS